MHVAESLMQEYEWLDQLQFVKECGKPPFTHGFWPGYSKWYANLLCPPDTQK